MSCPHCQTSELWWQATLYVLGEMGAADQEEFERHLEGCQRAREAVVRAMQLHETLQSIQPGSGDGVVAVAPPASSWLSATWAPTLAGVFSVTFAAIALLGLTWYASRYTAEVGAEPVAELAVRWASLQDVIEETASGAPAVVEPGVAELTASDSDEVFEEPDLADVPDWLLAAVEELNEESLRQ